MIAEAPFVFSVGALNLSLAGLAGLVATLRRGNAGELEAIDRYRLREIVEFSFANALFALALVPLSATLGHVELAIRILGVLAVAYHAGTILVLVRRQRARGVPFGVPATALILARVFGNSPDFWLNVQRRTDLWEAMHSPRDRRRIERARPLTDAA